MVRQTSLEVYKKIQECHLLSRLRLEVYGILYTNGPMTGAQVSDIFRKRRSGAVYSESIRNRLTELRDMGCVDEVGETIDPLTGNRSTLWDVNGMVPKKLKKKMTKYQLGIRDGIKAGYEAALKGQSLESILQSLEAFEKGKWTKN